MEDKKKIVIVVIVALLAVVAAVAMGMKSTGSKETETKFSDVPPKGIGKVDKSP